MTPLPKTDLATFSEGTRFLVLRPWTTLGLAALGMILAALAPFLQIRAGLTDEPVVALTITVAAVLPLELFFIPRFLLAADAHSGNSPLNAPGDWKVRFEERWLRSFAAKLLLWAAIFLGLLLFLVPGILVLLAFGWAPMRVLLRGESLLDAAKGSLALMLRAWPRVLFTASALGLTYLAAGVVMEAILEHFVPEPTLRQRLVHPILWAGNYVASLLNLWLSACLLALFQRVEHAPPPLINKFTEPMLFF